MKSFISFPRTDVEIRKVAGLVAKPKVDPFFCKNGSGASARDIDLFFLAMRDEEILGSVRFCIEEKIAMLRTMLIDESARRVGIGTRLLDSFREHLDENGIRDVYCIPYGHLISFYSQIGFELVDEERLPTMLQERLAQYRAKSTKVYTAMRRP